MWIGRCLVVWWGVQCVGWMWQVVCVLVGSSFFFTDPSTTVLSTLYLYGVLPRAHYTLGVYTLGVYTLGGYTLGCSTLGVCTPGPSPP